ncbi:MAG: PAS domain S-box protein [Rubrivivax sp.]|jgi:PAS domain S-box-containing protein|nr:PAS domain S-box protein [Rubrivivax sp.]MBK7260507.1 PAS domain S-box protein [Rubrivivax sp.]MBK8526182.1 PAS domain S-box protein [Rubrivivax sp.]
MTSAGTPVHADVAGGTDGHALAARPLRHAALAIAVLFCGWALWQGGIAAGQGERALLAVLAVALATALAASLWILLAYRRGMHQLHQAVREAHAGRIEPVQLEGLSRRLVGPLGDDYDALTHDVERLFGDMEQAQLSIIGERNRHEAILQSLPGALLIVDLAGRVRMSNLQAQTLFGQVSAAFDGANVFELLGVDEAGRLMLHEAFEQMQPVRNAVLAATIGAESRWISINLTFFRDSKKATESSAAVIVQDLTDRRRFEELTNQTEKLVAMGQLAGGVAHELNTPLGTILGYAQLLVEGKGNEARRTEQARIIHDETKRCARIIDDLLTYARRPVCDPERSEIGTVVLEAVEAVSNCQGRRLSVPIETELQGPVTVLGGSGQLDIVLVNLLVNAVQAAAMSARPQVQVRTGVEGGHAIVTVSDNGPGVPPQHRRKLFDPFFTTKADARGTGLGLPLSHAIITRVGGTLHCDPDFEGGARFILKLPLAT